MLAASIGESVVPAAALSLLGGYIPRDVVGFAARVFPAMVFWQSARTTVDGFSISMLEAKVSHSRLDLAKPGRCHVNAPQFPSVNRIMRTI